MNASFDILEHASVLIDGTKIAKISKSKIADDADQTYDFHGDVLMPGFVNAHAHSAMTLFRSGADDTPLDVWLHTQVFPLENGLDEECVYNGAYLAFAEYVRGGVTTIGDMYFYPDTMLAAVQKCGIGCASVSGTTDLEGKTGAELEELESRFLRLNGKAENFKYVLGVHSEYTTTDQLIDGVVKLSYRYKAPLYTHMSETLKEVGECTVRNNGLTPTMYLHKCGFFDNGATVAHGVHIDKEDIDILSSSNVSVVTNPCSNLKLASGIAPVATMLARGVNVAIGTDGAASNNALSVFREMYLASTLAKCSMSDASVVTAEQALKMATVCGAKSLFYDDRGCIEEGKRADLIRVSLEHPHFHPCNNIAKNLVYSAEDGDVTMTIAGGKVLYENGKYFIGESIDDIYKNAEKSARYLFKRAGIRP